MTYSGSAYASGTITSLVGQGSPEGLVVDGNKNLFYTDPSDSTVRELAHGNSITAIVAGTGFAGSSGLSSTALSTTLPLNMPQGLALSSDGTVFIADTGNHAVRHVAAGSLMSTIAGTGIAGFDGPTASGAGTALSLSNPVAVAVAGNGDVYIADQGNHAIRLWHQGTLSTVLGSGSAGNSGDGPATAGSAITDPEGVAIDGAGALFFTEGSAGRVRRFYQGQLSTLAVGLNSPRQLVITHTGDILVAAFGGNQLIALGACGIAVAHPNYPVCLPGSLLASARGGGKSAWASDEASSFVVAPNPAVSGGDLCLHFSSAPQSSAWSVYNILGELVLKASFYGQAEQCVANSLAPGVYFVRVDSRGSSGTTRSELRKVAVIR